MARLFQTGWEQNDTSGGTTGGEMNITGGSPTISSTTFRGGLYALRISSLASATEQGMGHAIWSSGESTPIYVRFYFRYATLPSAANTIFKSAAGSNLSSAARASIRLTSSGTLQLYNNTTQIGSDSSALSANTWYRIEVKWDSTGAVGADSIEGKIDGTSFASSSSITFSSTVNSISFGGNLIAEAQTTGDWFFDDVAVNDTNGSQQTGYPGDGKIIILRPNATGDSNTFSVQVGGTAGSGNNYTRVDEFPTDDATSYNGSATLNEEDLFNCDACGLSGVSITLVAVCQRMTNNSASATLAIKLEIMKTSGGTKSQSSDLIRNGLTWISYKPNTSIGATILPLVAYTDPDGAAWTPTTLDSMQIGYILSVADGARQMRVTQVWASVEYTDATVVSTPPKTPRLLTMGVG
jgi:hypothetical protein